jgi:tetratricopeptide (TPR) repeat protein
LAEQLLAVARQAAPDPAWSDGLRQLKAWRDQEAFAKLVKEAPVTRLSPQMLALVGRVLPDESSLRESWLRRGQFQYPADFWLNFNLANALLKTQPLEATGFYRVALAVRPASSAAYNNLGIALYAQKKLDEAIAACRKAIEIDPKLAAAYNTLGTALYAQKKVDEAIAAYREAIEIDPKSADAYSNLGGRLCDDLKEYDKAIECFRTAIDLDPKNATHHFYLGNALRNQQKLPEAVLAYRKATELDPNHAMAWQVLGWLQYRIGDWRVSIEALEKSCKLQQGGTGDAGQWIVLALAHAKLAAQEGLPEKEREHHKIEARRRYEQADKQIDTWWRARPGDEGGQAIWDFRAKARELLGAKESKK